MASSASWARGDLVEGGEDLLAALGLQVLRRRPAARTLSTVVPGRYLPVRKPEARRVVRDGGEPGAAATVSGGRPRRCRGRPGCSGAGGRRSGPGPRRSEKSREACRRSGGDVGGGDRADLARLHQLVEGGDDLLDGDRRVVEVGVVEVDVVRAEAPQRLLGAGLDGGGGQTLVVGVLAPTLVAMTTSSRLPREATQLADDGLGLAALVARRPRRSRRRRCRRSCRRRPRRRRGRRRTAPRRRSSRRRCRRGRAGRRAGRS